MAQGTITHVSDLGYGLIDYGAGRDLLFRASDVERTPFAALCTGDRVEFDIEPDPRGRGDRAVYVRRIDGPTRPRPRAAQGM